MKFYSLIHSITHYSDQFSVNLTPQEELKQTLEASDDATLRAWYHEVYAGECSNDGEMGEYLAQAAPREQLIEDLLFAGEAEL